MSYLDFLLIFLLPLICIELGLFIKIQSPRKSEICFGIGLLAILAVVYTTPWDNYLVATQVWGYGPDRVLGVIGYVPIEEYCFFVLQTILTGLWFFFVQNWIPITDKETASPKTKVIGSLLLLVLTVSGVFFIFNELSIYLGLILVWATPVLLLQWMVGGEYLPSNIKAFLWAVILPTVYLCIADAVAIHEGVWEISKAQILGLHLGPLPLEEAVFFLMTNLMLVQGLTLFLAMRDKVNLPIFGMRKREV